MAITKYYFIGQTMDAQASEMISWLQTNAMDYFDSVVIDNNIITCTIGNTPACVLDFNGGTSAVNLKILLDNGNSKNSDGRTNIWEYAVKCETGIILKSSSTIGAPASFPTYLYITRTDKNTVLMACTMYSSNYGHFYIGDFTLSPTWQDVYGQADRLYDSSYYSYYWSITSSITTLSPVASLHGSYAPNLYKVPFCEIPQTVGILSINGMELYTTSYLAMK